MNQKHTYEIGKVYGLKKLESIYYVDGRMVADVVCVRCGEKKTVKPWTLFHEKTTSCKCALKTVDGESTSRLYKIYHNMVYRCNTPTAPEYRNYGGRGIYVCDEWLGKDGYKNFKSWSIANGYDNDLTIDRINGDGAYCPENCRWVTLSENVRHANQENRLQHRRANKGTYYGVSDNGEYVEFDNASKFATDNNMNANRIRSSARYSRKYNEWRFGYIVDIISSIEPQSTIESAISSQRVEYIVGGTPAVEAPSMAHAMKI